PILPAARSTARVRCVLTRRWPGTKDLEAPTTPRTLRARLNNAGSFPHRHERKHGSVPRGPRPRWIGLCYKDMMRCFWAACLTALSCLAQDDLARARRIQSEVIGIDTHIDTAQRLLIGGVDISKRLADGQVDLPRLREGGMRTPFFSLWVPVYYHGAEAIRRTLDLRGAMRPLFDAQ